LTSFMDIVLSWGIEEVEGFEVVAEGCWRA